MNSAPRDDFVSLYRQAFAEYGTQAPWNRRAFAAPRSPPR
jgi:hypothetical protein